MHITLRYSRYLRYLRFRLIRLRRTHERYFIVCMCVVVGFISGLAAVLLKSAVRVIHDFVANFNSDWFSYVHYLIPVAGIVLTTLLMRYAFREGSAHGVTQLLYAISKKHAFIKRRRNFSFMLGSTITVGLGGSVGLESPVVVTGSAVASNLARWVGFGYRTRVLLIGCGAASAIAGIFNSPIAGALFAIEVILVDVTIFQFIPVLISAGLGTIVSQILLGDDVLFSFILRDPFLKGNIFYYILLGVICGFVALHFMRMNFFVEERIRRVKHPMKRALFGGLALAALIALAPPLYGEGYTLITTLLNGQEEHLLSYPHFSSDFFSRDWFLLVFLLLLLFLKPIAAAVTTGSGGCGGIFAPSLFMGAIGGYFFARTLNFFFPVMALSTSNFALAGMSAVLSGLLHAPLTAIFLIAEITDSYAMFVPLMLTATAGYLTINYFERYSFYSKHLIERGDLIPSENRDERILSQMKLSALIERDLLTISPTSSLHDLILLVRKSKRNIFPVLDETSRLCGIVTLDNIREIMFDKRKHRTVLVEELMSPPPISVSLDEPMRVIMQKFESTQLWNLPVEKHDKYVGFISKSRIFNAYRELLLTL